ncbi:MAG: NTP transferase domain-containing protein [Candidatus Heimdallarchaeota archaeon]|nr:NTP transferase domain-containing protein [Candidatus Heimdallarchaeota archaeon]MCK4954417.1 NTP transferase domain-containing protein [Candidatus Heimdallarchaeota archaeon]
MKVVILAGGKGSDLFPLTQTRPKPMITLLGKPILQYLIEELKEIGLTDILIVTGYLGEQIRNYFKKGSDLGVCIQYANQGEEERIESALLASEEYVRNESEFLLLFGDIVSEQGLIQRTLNAFENTQADMTMALTLKGDTGDFGIVEIDSMGMVKKAGIKKADLTSMSNYVDAGCFVIRTDIFDEIRKEKSLSSAINNRIEKGAKVAAAIWEKEWIDIGKPWNIIEANRLLLSKVEESRISKNVVIGPNVELKNVVIIEENTEIGSGTVLNGPLYIGPNTYIGNNALIRDHCSIDKNSLIGFGSEIKNSVLFKGVKIYRLCYIGDSVIGQNTVFSSGVITVNTETPNAEIEMNINGEIIKTGLRKLGAIIGDDCELGVNTMIFPGRKIASKSIITPGTTIKEDYE